MTRRLDVVQVSPSDIGGGAEAVALQLHRELNRRGHEATLVVGRKRGGEPGVVTLPQGRGPAWEAWRRLDGAGRYGLARLARAIAEPGTLADLARGYEDFRFPGARRLLEAVSATPDLVHLHNLHGGYFDLRVLPDLSARVPLVATLHDAWLLTGHCAHPFDSEGWLEGCGECPYLETYPRLRADGTRFNLARKRDIYAHTRLAVVTPSAWLMEMVDRSVLARAVARRAVIPNGVDLGVFAPRDRLEARRALGVAPAARLLLFAAQGGRANEFRDFPTLERALVMLSVSAQQTTVAVLGDPQNGEIRSRGNVSVQTAGRVDADGVARWLSAADVYVHSSRADTFPSGVLEALACGVPVVASRVGGIPEQLTEETGVLVEPGDHVALVHALEALLGDPDRRARMGVAAAADARARFSLDRQVDAYLGLYRELDSSFEPC